MPELVHHRCAHLQSVRLGELGEVLPVECDRARHVRLRPVPSDRHGLRTAKPGDVSCETSHVRLVAPHDENRRPARARVPSGLIGAAESLVRALRRLAVVDEPQTGRSLDSPHRVLDQRQAVTRLTGRVHDVVDGPTRVEGDWSRVVVGLVVQEHVASGPVRDLWRRAERDRSSWPGCGRGQSGQADVVQSPAPHHADARERDDERDESDDWVDPAHATGARALRRPVLGEDGRVAPAGLLGRAPALAVEVPLTVAGRAPRVGIPPGRARPLRSRIPPTHDGRL